MVDEIYITDNSDSAKELIGKKCYYCTYTYLMFNEDELDKCHTDERHGVYGCCWCCDRRNLANFKKFNTQGQYMKPLGKDPMLQISFSDMSDEKKLKRILKKI